MSIDDNKLSELFASLPTERANEQFADEVIRRVQRRRSERFATRRTVFTAIATAAAIACFAIAGSHIAKRLKESAAEKELAALRLEHRQITDEFAALQKDIANNRYILLGSDNRADYVLDVTNLRNMASDPSPQPGAHLGKAGRTLPLLCALARGEQGGTI